MNVNCIGQTLSTINVIELFRDDSIILKMKISTIIIKHEHEAFFSCLGLPITYIRSAWQYQQMVVIKAAWHQKTYIVYNLDRAKSCPDQTLDFLSLKVFKDCMISQRDGDYKLKSTSSFIIFFNGFYVTLPVSLILTRRYYDFKFIPLQYR